MVHGRRPSERALTATSARTYRVFRVRIVVCQGARKLDLGRITRPFWSAWRRNRVLKEYYPIMNHTMRFIYLVDRLERAGKRYAAAENADERRRAGRWLVLRNRSVQVEFARNVSVVPAPSVRRSRNSTK